jgi:transcriptional regulator with XRE-family HTH domain
MDNISKKIIDVRKGKNISQRKLSDLTNVEQSTIAKIELNKTMPRVDTLMKILDVLGIEIKIAHPLYGIVDFYKGSGTLEHQSENDVQYEITQFVNGTILVQMELKNFGELLKSGISLHINSKRKRIKLSNILINNSNIKFIKDKGLTSTYTINPKNIDILIKDTDIDNLKYEFHLTNFTFEKDFELTINNLKIQFKKIDHYKEILEQLERFKNVNITAKLIIQSNSITKEIEKEVQSLCDLISFYQGNCINWIKYIVYNEDDIVKIVHRRSITKNFNSFQVVKDLPFPDCEYGTKEAIEKTFENYENNKEIWKLNNVIYSLNDGKIEGDYLELRGLKIAISMEILKFAYIKKSNLDKDDKFTFVLKKIISELNLDIHPDEVKKFVKIRNALVHTGSYLKENPHLNNYAFNQYKLLMNFANKLILGILNYKGYFLDYSKEYGYISPDMEMRQLFKYKDGSNKGEF